MKQETTFVLERAPFTTKDGREMYGYFVRYNIHGKDYKADFEAKLTQARALRAKGVSVELIREDV